MAAVTGEQPLNDKPPASFCFPIRPLAAAAATAAILARRETLALQFSPCTAMLPSRMQGAEFVLRTSEVQH
jgi:hypothetical protein